MAKRKARFKKGSAAAKAFMAKLRAMQGGRKRVRKPSKRYRNLRQKMNTPWRAPAVTISETRADAELKKLRSKGRRIAKAAGVKPFYFTGKPQLIVSEGEFGMAKKRRKSRKSAVHGFDGRKRRSTRYHGRRKSYSRRRRRGVLMGGIGGQGVPALLMQGAVGAAGAIGAAFVANKIPGVPSKVKPIIPLAAAVALLMFGKKIPMVKPLAFGCAMSGVLGFAKQMAPNLPTLAGVESAPELSAEDAALLGGPQTFGAVADMMGAVSPADI